MKDTLMRLSFGSIAALCLLPTGAFAHADHETVAENALAAPSQIVDCTLENGDAAQCASYTVKSLPMDLEIGPFCPATLDDVGGLWEWDGMNEGTYLLDRAFFEMLDDQGYSFYDEDENVYIFDIRTEGPTADHECISASLDEAVEMTALIPIEPVMADAPTELGTVAKVGIGIDGVPVFADAPSVLERSHMPALDVCGGHIDPGGWYHWHATATDIATPLEQVGIASTCSVPQDSAALFAYAFDGFAIYGHTDVDGSVPTDLDDCSGHIGATASGGDAAYHYHASETFPNLPNCLVGVSATGNFSTTAAQGIGSTRGDRGGPPNLSEAAEALGIDADILLEALSAAGGPDADLSAVAKTLNVSEEALRAAFPAPNR
jgi:hypothetical protein